MLPFRLNRKWCSLIFKYLRRYLSRNVTAKLFNVFAAQPCNIANIVHYGQYELTSFAKPMVSPDEIGSRVCLHTGLAGYFFRSTVDASSINPHATLNEFIRSQY